MVGNERKPTQKALAPSCASFPSCVSYLSLSLPCCRRRRHLVGVCGHLAHWNAYIAFLILVRQHHRRLVRHQVVHRRLETLRTLGGEFKDTRHPDRRVLFERLDLRLFVRVVPEVPVLDLLAPVVLRPRFPFVGQRVRRQRGTPIEAILKEMRKRPHSLLEKPERDASLPARKRAMSPALPEALLHGNRDDCRRKAVDEGPEHPARLPPGAQQRERRRGADKEHPAGPRQMRPERRGQPQPAGAAGAAHGALRLEQGADRGRQLVGMQRADQDGHILQ
mmetsp:Transcript_38467/g.109977  ORF Transcript_38467/g.109977 Transcript_38467/m.109977 type:complete len:278 (+) Transcript_38467:238-1071(+)